MFAALVVGALWMGIGELGSTNPGEYLCRPTSLFTLQVSLHRVISDFSFLVLSRYLLSILCHPLALLLFFPSFFLLHPFCCSLTFPSLVLLGLSPVASFFLPFHLSWPFPSPLYPTKHVPMSPEKKQKRNKEMQVTRNTLIYP